MHVCVLETYARSLALAQGEWDAVMLESFTLKKHLDSTRQELSHALYQNDAACRVIARLQRENGNLRQVRMFGGYECEVGACGCVWMGVGRWVGG